MDTINSEGDLDALRRHASAWAVLLAWARMGLFELLSHGEPCQFCWLCREAPARLGVLPLPLWGESGKSAEKRARGRFSA